MQKEATSNVSSKDKASARRFGVCNRRFDERLISALRAVAWPEWRSAFAWGWVDRLLDAGMCHKAHIKPRLLPVCPHPRVSKTDFFSLYASL